MNIFNYLKLIAKTGEFNKVIASAKSLSQLNSKLSELNNTFNDIEVELGQQHAIIENDIDDTSVRLLVQDRVNQAYRIKSKPIAGAISNIKKELDKQISIFNQLIAEVSSQYSLYSNKVYTYNSYCKRYGLVMERKDMPQIDDCLSFISDCNLKYTEVAISVNQLKPTQVEIQSSKILNMLYSIDKTIDRKLIVSSDGYILDGHHHWATLLEIDPSYSITVYRVDCNIVDLLDKAHTYLNSKIEKALQTIAVAYESEMTDRSPEFNYVNKSHNLINRLKTCDLSTLKQITSSSLHYTVKNIAKYLRNGSNSR